MAGVEGAIDGALNGLPAGAAGAMLNENTWKSGDPLSVIAKASGMGAVQGAGMGAAMGAGMEGAKELIGAIRSRGGGASVEPEVSSSGTVEAEGAKGGTAEPDAPSPGAPDETAIGQSDRPSTLDDVVDKMPEETVMQPADGTDGASAKEMYENSRLEDPTREVALYRNPETGEYIVVQGKETVVSVGGGEAPREGGVGQRWKEILAGGDVGRWELQAHSHPSGPGGVVDPVNMWPSGANADMGAMAVEARASGEARSSRIDYVTADGPNHTEFGVDPAHERPYWVEHPDGAGGRTVDRFKSMESYHDFLENKLGAPSQGDIPPELSGLNKAPTAVDPLAPRAADAPTSTTEPTLHENVVDELASRGDQRGAHDAAIELARQRIEALAESGHGESADLYRETLDNLRQKAARGEPVLDQLHELAQNAYDDAANLRRPEAPPDAGPVPGADNKPTLGDVAAAGQFPEEHPLNKVYDDYVRRKLAAGETPKSPVDWARSQHRSGKNADLLNDYLTAGWRAEGRSTARADAGEVAVEVGPKLAKEIAQLPHQDIVPLPDNVGEGDLLRFRPAERPPGGEPAYRRYLDSIQGDAKLQNSLSDLIAKNPPPRILGDGRSWPVDSHGNPLEVHHQRPLSVGGPDDISNWVVIEGRVHDELTEAWSKLEAKYRRQLYRGGGGGQRDEFAD